jgi:hypothetical protein
VTLTKDHWLNYSPPRGWLDPFTLRSRLAANILYALTGSSPKMEEMNKTLLINDPKAWLIWATNLKSADAPLPSTSSALLPELQALPVESSLSQPSVVLTGQVPTKTDHHRTGGAVVAAVIGLVLLLLLKRRKT